MSIYCIWRTCNFFSCPSAHFCLDTVHVGCDGQVLFLKPKNRGGMPKCLEVLCYCWPVLAWIFVCAIELRLWFDLQNPERNFTLLRNIKNMELLLRRCVCTDIWNMWKCWMMFKRRWRVADNTVPLAGRTKLLAQESSVSTCEHCILPLLLFFFLSPCMLCLLLFSAHLSLSSFWTAHHLRFASMALLLFSGLQPSSVCLRTKSWQYRDSWRDCCWRWRGGCPSRGPRSPWLKR